MPYFKFLLHMEKVVQKFPNNQGMKKISNSHIAFTSRIHSPLTSHCGAYCTTSEPATPLKILQQFQRLFSIPVPSMNQLHHYCVNLWGRCRRNLFDQKRICMMPHRRKTCKILHVSSAMLSIHIHICAFYLLQIISKEHCTAPKHCIIFSYILCKPKWAL